MYNGLPHYLLHKNYPPTPVSPAPPSLDNHPPPLDNQINLSLPDLSLIMPTSPPPGPDLPIPMRQDNDDEKAAYPPPVPMIEDDNDDAKDIAPAPSSSMYTYTRVIMFI